MSRLNRSRRRLPGWLAFVLTLALGYLIATLQGVLIRPALVLEQDAAYAGAQARSERVTGGPLGLGGELVISPTSGPARTLLILYPGGLVRPQAYEWLGRALAARDVQTVIPVFPLDLAVTNAGAAAGLIARYGQGKRMYLAGHSLGGAMAAQWAAGHPQGLSGLILMGAYPPGGSDLSGAGFPVLDLQGEHDRVAKGSAVQDGLKRLPPGTRLTVIPGSVHSFFGRYGPQKGDGLPTVTRAEAEARIVAEVRGFVGGQ